MGIGNVNRPITPGQQMIIDQNKNGPLNPGGRPKGSLNKKSHPSVKERLLGKWKTHPVDKLVSIANFIEASDPSRAAEIWADLLKYFESSKKPVAATPGKTTPEESRLAAEEAHRLLKEIEDNGYKQDTEGSNGSGVETGTPKV